MQKWIAVIVIGAFVGGLALVERSNLSRELEDSQNLIGVQDAQLSVQNATIVQLEQQVLQLEQQVLQQADELNASADSAEEYKVLTEQYATLRTSYEQLAAELATNQGEDEASAERLATVAAYIAFTDVLTYPVLYDYSGTDALDPAVITMWVEELHDRAWVIEDVFVINAVNDWIHWWPPADVRDYSRLLRYCILKTISLIGDGSYSWVPGSQ